MKIYQVCILIFFWCHFFESKCAALEIPKALPCSTCKRERSHDPERYAVMSIEEKDRELRQLMKKTEIEDFRLDPVATRIKNLICAGASPNLLEHCDKEGEFGDKRLLFMYRHDHAMVSFLLAHGANPNLIACGGCPTIFFVTKEPVFNTLIKHGAKIEKRGKIYAETILHKLVQHINEGFPLSLLEYCIQNGISVNEQDVYGDTPLRNLEIVCGYYNEQQFPLLKDKIRGLLEADYALNKN